MFGRTFPKLRRPRGVTKDDPALFAANGFRIAAPALPQDDGGQPSHETPYYTKLRSGHFSTLCQVSRCNTGADASRLFVPRSVATMPPVATIWLTQKANDHLMISRRTSDMPAFESIFACSQH